MDDNLNVPARLKDIQMELDYESKCITPKEYVNELKDKIDRYQRVVREESRRVGKITLERLNQFLKTRVQYEGEQRTIHDWISELLDDAVREFSSLFEKDFIDNYSDYANCDLVNDAVNSVNDAWTDFNEERLTTAINELDTEEDDDD